MNYIDKIAEDIYYATTDSSVPPSDEDMFLYRIYAVLALSTGEDTTNQHVHDAWAAYTTGLCSDYPSLVPFGQLERRVQDLDIPYRDAIIDVARGLKDGT